jgi:MinD superfamily P-loop ATPase
VKELVIISGKGGTGKTSVTAAFARLAVDKVLADCDVDAADLHLVVSAAQGEPHAFSARKRAAIDPGKCTLCGECLEHCRFDAIDLDPPRIDPFACEGCGLCSRLCSAGAIDFAPVVNGEWSLAETPWGPLVHARLGVAEDNSGKLVSLVREEARKVAQNRALQTVLIDGAPGIGCPVIASLTGATLVLVVTEPTVSGRHDLGRVLELTHHFGLPVAVCINKSDVNAQTAGEIAEEAQTAGALFVSSVRYDRAVTEAMVRGGSVVDGQADGRRDGAAADLATLWLLTAAALDRCERDKQERLGSATT